MIYKEEGKEEHSRERNESNKRIEKNKERKNKGMKGESEGNYDK
jgi:hypothetical protein